MLFMQKANPTKSKQVNFPLQKSLEADLRFGLSLLGLSLLLIRT